MSDCIFDKAERGFRLSPLQFVNYPENENEFPYFRTSTRTTYLNYPSPPLKEKLKKIANAIVAPGKGILAADESTAQGSYGGH